MLGRVGPFVATSDVEQAATAGAGVAISLKDLQPTLTPTMAVDGDAERIAAPTVRIRATAAETG